MEEIKPCPFCGESIILFYIVSDGGDCPPKGFKEDWAAECEKCLAEGPWGKSRDEAIEKWNKRLKEA